MSDKRKKVGPSRVQKSARKVAETQANKSTVFERTEFGRKRIQPFSKKMAFGLLCLVSVPFVLAYHAFRGVKKAA